MRINLLFCLTAVILFQCKNKPAAGQYTTSESDLPKDFQEFYQKFHTDSAYQMAHIQWPLKGETGIGQDTLLRRQLIEWTPENWRMMHLPDVSMSTLKRTFEPMGEVIIVERMSYPMVGIGYERQFYKEEDGSWRLIYYAESTPMVQ